MIPKETQIKGGVLMHVARIVQPNLLEGPLRKNILRFSLPLRLTNVLQNLYSSADLVIVGHSGAAGAVGAIGNTMSMNSLFLNLCIGFALGANVVVARHIGAGERGKTRRAAHCSVLMGLLFGLVSCLLGQALCRWVLTAMGAQGESLRLSEVYCRIYFAGLPFISLTNVLAAILRAKGDTATPLAVISLCGLLKVLLNLLFIFVLHMDVDGVALSTGLSNLLSAAVLFALLCRDTGWCRITPRKLRFDRESVRETLYVGIPAGLNSAFFQLSNMQIQSAVIQVNNAMYPGGSAVIDGHAAAYSLENIVYTAVNSVYQAAVTFTSQHFGATKYKRIGRVMLCSYFLAALVAGILGGAVCLFEDTLVGLFVREKEALQAAAVRNAIMLSTYALVGTMDVGTGLLRGMGKSLTATVITLLGVCVFRVFWILILFPKYPTLECIYISYPCSWLLTTAAGLILSLRVWKKLCKTEEGKV